MGDTIITSTLDGNVLIVETTDGPVAYDSKFLVAALLIYVAKGSGQIEPEESAKMIELIQQHFELQSAESLELLTRAMSEMAEQPNLGQALADLARTLSDKEKEDIALMALKVVAADGAVSVSEMDQFNTAVEAANISAEIVHRAFDRYFAETMPSG
ncbi:MAG: TerB family tellurite resistance protein [Gammaproteobacteria bacterium]|nr:TerB family tellurite resistance protein [Gammaproteobacteria bacterium]